MRNLLKGLIVALSIVFLAGCHTTDSSVNIFSPKPTDASITATVKQALAENQLLANAPVHVETMNGAVKLSGYVRTIRQSDAALEVATRAPGVKSVQNNLVVRARS